MIFGGGPCGPPWIPHLFGLTSPKGECRVDEHAPLRLRPAVFEEARIARLPAVPRVAHPRGERAEQGDSRDPAQELESVVVRDAVHGAPSAVPGARRSSSFAFRAGPNARSVPGALSRDAGIHRRPHGTMRAVRTQLRKIGAPSTGRADMTRPPRPNRSRSGTLLENCSHRPANLGRSQTSQVPLTT